MKREPWLMGLLATGLVARLVLVAAGLGQPPARWEYDALAESLLGGRGYVYEHLGGVPYRAYYSGLPYVAALAACRFATDSDLPVQLLQALLALAGACCAWDLAGSLAGRKAAFAAAAATLLHPGLMYYDVARVHPLGLDTALGLASLCALRRALASEAPGPSWLAGAALGLAVLQRGALLPFALLAPLLLVRHRPRSAGLVWAGAALALAPWLLRNALVLGTPELSTTTAEHFWIGNAPGSTGGSLAPDGNALLSQLPGDRLAALGQTDELGQARLFRELISERAAREPLAVARGVAWKLLHFFSVAPHTGLRYPRAWTFVHLACYAPLLALAVLGAWRRRAEPLVVWIVLLALSVALVHALAYFELRHRLALEPLLAVLASARFDLARRGCK
jgi:4-amino-4-deoxy-L-arabinose transferase-like glycosyltransferase